MQPRAFRGDRIPLSPARLQAEAEMREIRAARYEGGVSDLDPVMPGPTPDLRLNLRDPIDLVVSENGEDVPPPDALHPDTIGVSRREPRSILSEPPRGRISSIPRPKSPAGKPAEPNPYAYSRHGRMGRWQQRG